MGQTSQEQVMRKNPDQPVVRIVIEPRVSTRTIMNIFAATSIITVGSMITAICAKLIVEVLDAEIDTLRGKVVKDEEKGKSQSLPRPAKKEKTS
jgi:hypothetical protein